MTRTLILCLAAARFVAAVAGCGKQGDLDRPGPIWSAQDKAEAAAQKRAQADNASNAAAANRAIGPQNPAVQPYTTTDAAELRADPRRADQPLRRAAAGRHPQSRPAQ